jgi:hypothetical protein
VPTKYSSKWCIRCFLIFKCLVFSKGSLISRVCNSYGGSKNLVEKKFKEKIFFLAGLLELKKKIRALTIQIHLKGLKMQIIDLSEKPCSD